MEDKIKFLGINIDDLTKDQLFKKIQGDILSNKKVKIMYVNAHCINIAHKDKEYLNVLNSSNIVYADGMSIIWGSKLLGTPLRERLTAADFIFDFFKICEEKGYSLFLFGGKNGIAKKATDNIKKNYRNIKIIGNRCGYFTNDENSQIINELNQENPHILLVGFGAPLQEKWIHENIRKLNCFVVWGVGGLFDHLAGNLKPTPIWMRISGLEWLAILLQQPQKWKRYLIGNLIFCLRLIRYKFLLKRQDGRKV